MDSFVPFINCKQCCKIWLDDILYLRQEERLAYIVTEKETFCSYNKIRNYDQYLDRRFYYCLKSIIINFQQVNVMKDQTIYFKNGDNISLGRQNYIRTKQAFAGYLLQQRQTAKTEGKK